MAEKHDWFEPYFAGRLRSAGQARPASAMWVPLARRSAYLPARVRRRVRAQADLWYHRHLMGPFLGAWHGVDELAELREYLGDSFDPQRLADHRAGVDEEERSSPDPVTFYRTSEAYLYDLAMFAVWGTKEPYRAVLAQVVPPPARLLDYGCGIGSDGLRLLGEGYEVSFADYDNPSTRYLRWRLNRREPRAEVYDIEQAVPGGFDLVYSFDVIEHVDDPFAFLAELESKAGLVMVNLLEPDPADTHLHHRLPVARLVAHAARRGLVYYHRYGGRSHLMVYRSPGGATSLTWAARSGRPLAAGLAERLAERLVPMR